jgi:hypothetical protein
MGGVVLAGPERHRRYSVEQKRVNSNKGTNPDIETCRTLD